MPETSQKPIIDISVPVSADTPRWPGSPAFEATRWLDLHRGDVATDTVIRGSVHLGTHIDAPAHFLRGGATVDAIPLETMVGKCWVLDIPRAGAIDARDLADAWPEAPVERVLLRTLNSAYWSTAGSRFVEEFTAVSAEGAAWLVDQGVQLAGIDYLSIQRFSDPPDTHLIMLGAGIVILEGLNLQDVAPGPYELLCLPLRLHGTEAAPVRAVLRPL